MLPKPPDWVDRTNAWISLADYVRLAATFVTGCAATLWFGPDYEIGWGAVLWGGAFFSIILSLAAAFAAWAYSVVRGNRATAAAPAPPSGPSAVAASNHSSPISATDSAPQLAAKRTLAIFVTNHLLPACNAQKKLQFAILKRLCGSNAALLDVADQGSLCHKSLESFMMPWTR